jgi:hypothetical protein
MWGICGLLPSCRMASRISAIGRGNARQRIVAANVALRASNYCQMAIGQRETGCTVIEDSRGPSGDRVARSTLRRCNWKPGRNVIWYHPAGR